jgi:serine phosphatase RsbU (regulator of sigma subunit)/ligand-binding sensor domain-containing protein
MKEYKIFLSIILAASSFLFAQQNYQIKNFVDIEKLSNNQITDIIQDSYGFMWIATEDGLNRYDGKTAKIYKNIQDDDESLPDNECGVLLEDNDKNIWVACFNSIGRLDRKTDKFKRYSLENISFKSPAKFYSGIIDNQGRIWFTTSELGLIRFDESSDQFINIELSASNKKKTWGAVGDVIQLRNGLILAADISDGIKAYNEETDQFDPYYLTPNYSPDKVYLIHEGSAGAVWFAGSGILIKYSPLQYSVKKYNLLNYSKLNSEYDNHNGLVEDSHGNLWMGLYTHGLFKFNKEIKEIEQYLHDPGDINSLKDNKISNLYKDKYGIIWITYVDGGISQIDPNSNPFEYFPINLQNNNKTIITTISQSPIDNSSLILGTNSDGVVNYNMKLKSSEFLNLKDVSIKKDSNNSVNDLAVDYKGNIWYSINNSQLKKFDISTNRLEVIESPHKRKTAQPLVIRSIKVSPNNKIWISSNYGVDRYDPVTRDFYSVPRIMNKRMSRKLSNELNNIRKSRKPLSSIIEVGEGQNLDTSLILENETKLILISVGEGRANGGMFDNGGISDPEGKTIWAMSDIYETFYNGGGFKNRIGIKLLTLNKGDYKLRYSSDVGHSFKDWNTISPDDSLYWGIEAYEINDLEFEKLNNLLSTEIKNTNHLPFELGRLVKFSKANSNIIWIGTELNSFFKYDITSNKYTQYNYNVNNPSDASHYIICFHEDLDGILWVGTYSSFVRLDPRTNQLNSFSTDDGLPGGNIFSISEDNNGALWIYSSGGLSRLNKNAPIEDYSFVNYDVRDGLEGLAQTTAILKNENGRIFIGGKGGIISFLPGSLNTIEPDVVVYDFKIDDVSTYDDSTVYKLDKSIFETEKINLSYSQNNIAFEFSSIHFSRPSKNKLAYTLEGFSRKWYESDRNFASFTNLNPGDYKFKVKGSNGDGIWNETGRSIEIIISPPWWQTTYAYIGYAAFFMLIIFGVDRIQRRRLLSKAKEKMRIQNAEHRAEAAELQSRAIQAENDRKTQELEEARQLQLSMLPKDLPKLPNLDIAVYMQTATEVGGDYYDFHIAMDGTLTVVIGDATGHGMKAGTMVTSTKTLFNTLAPNPDIVETFHEMTRCLKLMQMEKLSMCLTMLKITGNKIQMSSAGMPPVFIYKRENQTIEEHVIKGMPLGTFIDFPYSIVESDISIGDTILLMSDGFPELQNDEKEMYGYKRARNYFEEIAGESPEEIISKLKTAGSNWVKDKDPDDDVTFVVIKVK